MSSLISQVNQGRKLLEESLMEKEIRNYLPNIVMEELKKQEARDYKITARSLERRTYFELRQSFDLYYIYQK